MTEEVQNVYELFKDYYGEHRIDINYTDEYSLTDIIVYWDSVEITNEYDHTITIWKLFSKIQVTYNGKLHRQPLFKRSMYNDLQWRCNYMHSHINGIPKSSLREWKESCLGSGPLVTRCEFLREHYDEDIWRLFIWELDKYVHVESLIGVPYYKMSEVSDTKEIVTDFNVLKSTLAFDVYARSMYVYYINLIIRYVIEHRVLKFKFDNGHYSLAMSFRETVIALSNAFFHIYNSTEKKRDSKATLINRCFIEKKIITDFGVSEVNLDSESNLEHYLGREVLRFKGEIVKLEKYEGDNSSTTPVYMLNVNVVNLIVNRIINFININYGKVQTDKRRKVL